MKKLVLGMALMAALLIASAAHAQTVTLSCVDRKTNAEATVKFSESGKEAGFARAGQDPPADDAEFTATQITWMHDGRSTGGYVVRYTLNRSTGTLDEHTFANSFPDSNYTCTVAGKKF